MGPLADLFRRDSPPRTPKRPPLSTLDIPLPAPQPLFAPATDPARPRTTHCHGPRAPYNVYDHPASEGRAAQTLRDQRARGAGETWDGCDRARTAGALSLEGDFAQLAVAAPVPRPPPPPPPYDPLPPGPPLRPIPQRPTVPPRPPRPPPAATVSAPPPLPPGVTERRRPSPAQDRGKARASGGSSIASAGSSYAPPASSAASDGTLPPPSSVGHGRGRASGRGLAAHPGAGEVPLLLLLLRRGARVARLHVEDEREHAAQTRPLVFVRALDPDADRPHARGALVPSGAFVRSSAGAERWFRFADWIPEDLPAETQALLRHWMARSVSERDCEGFIYVHELVKKGEEPALEAGGKGGVR
ncbi:hypothetical protein JCM10450v2_002211 [Rhodotorula kratochvilovae]